MNSILVLLYHGVTDQSAGKFNNLRNYNKKHLNKNTFEKQIESINKSCEVISIDQLVHYWNTNYEIKKPTVVITFDDGFRNNYSIAKPILEKYEVPATFYISTGNVSEQKLFWVDLLEIIFSKTRIKEINSKTFPTIYSFIPNQKNLQKFNIFCKSLIYIAFWRVSYCIKLYATVTSLHSGVT